MDGGLKGSFHENFFEVRFSNKYKYGYAHPLASICSTLIGGMALCFNIVSLFHLSNLFAWNKILFEIFCCIFHSLVFYSHVL